MHVCVFCVVCAAACCGVNRFPLRLTVVAARIVARAHGLCVRLVFGFVHFADLFTRRCCGRRKTFDVSKSDVSLERCYYDEVVFEGT